MLTELKRTSDSPSVSREAYTQIQERLREALIADEAALRAWLEKEALLTIAEGAGEEFLEAASDTATLGPVIAAMDAPDREYFEHAIAAQVLYETASGLYEASRQELQAVEFAHGA